MFLKIIYTKKICIKLEKIYHLKNKRKLKIELFRYTKSIRTVEKFSF